MKYLVTGGSGFIGSHLVDKLVRQGHKVVIWDNYSTGKKKNENPKALYYNIDVAGISPDFHNIKYEAIFHLAGEARIQPSFKNPALTHDSNVTGTLKILEVAKRHCTKVIYAGSSSVYHDQYANPYSFTKMKAEEYCTLYNKVYEVPVAIARFFNVYGPRQLEEGAYATVIGIFERQRREKVPLTITGDGEQRRDFTHVEDIVDGLIAMSKDEWRANIFNLGTGTNHSINELAAMFQCPVKHIPSRPGEAQDTLADISFSMSHLNWKPKHSLVIKCV